MHNKLDLREIPLLARQDDFNQKSCSKLFISMVYSMLLIFESGEEKWVGSKFILLEIHGLRPYSKTLGCSYSAVHPFEASKWLPRRKTRACGFHGPHLNHKRECTADQILSIKKLVEMMIHWV